jgi:hypothetical protein
MREDTRLMSRNTKIYLCGDSPCPTDDEFVHRVYYGCVPKTFSERTGRAKGHHNQKCAVEGCYKYHWDGGCVGHTFDE